MFRLDGKVALVTGSSRGLGAAMAKALASAGARVAIHHRANPEQAERVAREIIESNGRCHIFQADVTRQDECERLVQEVLAHFASIDILVNNAGIRKDSLLHRMTREEWDMVIQTNLNSLYYITKPVVVHMIKKGWGRIINVSSLGPFAGSPGQANYSASKMAVVGFTHSLARELGPKGITVNAIAPGLIETDFTRDLPERYRNILIMTIPVGRFGVPEEVACGVVFLASDEARYINGHTLHINGGGFMQ
ncbi:MAG: 3-oxoacyl-ACP reductase family protein [bacterium JZ-2024 1]